MITGQIIHRQLMALGTIDLMAWGAKNFQSFSEKFFKEDLSHLGGLFFKVNALLHKQKVMIRLQGNDLYHVEIGNIRNGVWVKKKNSETKTDIYCDDLIDIIDAMVEGTKNKSPEEARKMYQEAGELFF